MVVSAVVFGVGTIVFGLVVPDQRPHAFHNAIVASLLIVLSVPPVIAVARSSESAGQPLVILAVVAAAALATMTLSLTIDPFTLPFVILVGVLWFVAKPRGDLLPTGRRSVMLIALMAAAAAPLVAYALGQADLQRTDRVSEHAAFFHWVETSFYALAIVLLAALAAIRPVPYRLAGWMAGTALAILGAASVLLPGYASAVAGPWSWLAFAGGLAMAAVTEAEYRRGVSRSLRAEPSKSKPSGLT